MTPTWHRRPFSPISRRRSPLLLEMLEGRDCPANLPGADIVWRTYNDADAFTLHSNPTSTHKLYLDFDGHDFTGTIWAKTENNGNGFTTAAGVWIAIVQRSVRQSGKRLSEIGLPWLKISPPSIST